MSPRVFHIQSRQFLLPLRGIRHCRWAALSKLALNVETEEVTNVEPRFLTVPDCLYRMVGATDMVEIKQDGRKVACADVLGFWSRRF